MVTRLLSLLLLGIGAPCALPIPLVQALGGEATAPVAVSWTDDESGPLAEENGPTPNCFRNSGLRVGGVRGVNGHAEGARWCRDSRECQSADCPSRCRGAQADRGKTDPHPREPKKHRGNRDARACIEEDDSDGTLSLERGTEEHGRTVVEGGDRSVSPPARRDSAAGPSGAGTLPLIYLLSRVLL